MSLNLSRELGANAFSHLQGLSNIDAPCPLNRVPVL